jgi:predicted component of viral defense system (DUF524 family)
MTYLDLDLRSRRGDHADLSAGHPRLQAEAKWLLEGPKEKVHEIYKRLQGLAELLTPELIELDFGNCVGFFDLPIVGRLEVVSGKFDEQDFNRMLAELSGIPAALPFASGLNAALPYDRSVTAQEDVLYHAFVYLRHTLSTTSRHSDQLLLALRVVLEDPHRLFFRVRRSVQPFHLRRADSTTLLRAVSGTRELLVPVALAKAIPLASRLGGYLPDRMSEPRVEMTHDTDENRFVKNFLRGAEQIIEQTRAAISQKVNQDAFCLRTVAQCDVMLKQLRPFSQNRFWRDVGTMTRLPTNSTVLQGRRGYRDIFRHFVTLRLSSRIPISRDLARDLMEAKDIALLYEIWCFFVLVREMQNILGPPLTAVRLSGSELQLNLSPELDVRWKNGTSLSYNPRFSRGRGEPRFSYSLPLRPDIGVQIPSGPNRGLHLFDAKFKLRKIETVMPEADNDEVLSNNKSEELRGTFKHGDLYKMHTYRDAIRAAKSVWALYPGDEFRFFSENGARLTAPPQSGTSELAGVGAIPLTPKANGIDFLEGVLRSLVSSLALDSLGMTKQARLSF